MLRRLFGWLFSTSAEKADVQDTRPRQRDDESRDENPWAADQEALADSWADEDADLDEEEDDWDEYDDEIASAVAFASWQDASAPQWDWGEYVADTVVELEEAYGETWEDWVGLDERENDPQYNGWSIEEEEDERY